jgi:hypothetical protein
MSEELAWPNLVLIDLRSAKALSEDESPDADEIYASAIDVPDLLTEVKRLRQENLNLREMIEAGGDRARRLEGANTKLTSDAKWLFGEFGWEHWRECDIPDEEDGGCGSCAALKKMRPEYGN